VSRVAAAGTRVAPAGSRARSRELGYAAAMLEMSQVLRGAAETWQAVELAAAADGNLQAAEMFGKIGAWLDEYGSYAFGAWQLHDDYRGRFARNMEHLALLERKYGDPPAREDLPRRAPGGN
jgi:hypothetical protein